MTNLGMSMFATKEDYWKARAEEAEAENFKLRAALLWCGGSHDFGPGGQAEEGWNKTCRPLLDA